MEKPKPLSKEEIQRIFEEDIKPDILSRVKSVNEPKAVFLAGQPGAGKTKLSEVTIKELNNNAVVIDIDELRQYHPKIKEVSNQYELDADTRQWKTMLIQECAKNKFNVVFDGTLGGNMQYIEPEMQHMKDNNFTVKINALAVNDSISKLGFISRYEDQVAKNGRGRNVDLSYHNDIYKNIPNNLTIAIGKGLVSEMSIYNRNHETSRTEHLKTYGKDVFKSSKDLPIYDFDVERSRPLKEKEVQELKKWYTKTIDVALKNNSNIITIKETIATDDLKASDTLKKQITEIKDIDYKQMISNKELKEAVSLNDRRKAQEAIIAGAELKSLKQDDFKHLGTLGEKAMKVAMQEALGKVASIEKQFQRQNIDSRNNLST